MPTRCGSTASASGRERDSPFPASMIRLLDPKRAARDRLRLLPHDTAARAAVRAARGRGSGGARASTRCAPTRCARPRRAAARPVPTCCCCSATRSTRTSRRPRSSRRSPSASGRPTRLRTSWPTSRVRARLSRGMVASRRSAGCCRPVADDDDLRRSRDPRRVADLAGLAGRDERRAVVRPPHPRRAWWPTGSSSTSATCRRTSSHAGGLYDEVRARGRRRRAARLADGHGGPPDGHSRWSFARELGDARLVVIDSRAGREVTPGRRELIQRRGVGVDRRAGDAARRGICCSRARCRSCSRPAFTTSRRSTRRSPTARGVASAPRSASASGGSR